MKRIKKLVASALIVSSILVTSSVGSFAQTNNTPHIAKQQVSILGGFLPRGGFVGSITIGDDIIMWGEDYNYYQVVVKEWNSLADFQADPVSGGSKPQTLSTTNNYMEYDFTSGCVYKVYVYGMSGSKRTTIGGYEWEE
ncbi:hypothetical protein [Ruminiclostridium cellulolyticum]|uniref:Uncharacterized protein n=1 Tax=Ruminiclostridium cellulolyticum (strain ATCC 35319 / DSM 5812 / JCM 6584 / H10) TaxID=394503 RepID=B8I7H4_RUMCH|nr:hypothetical protein [Ruminiclostridium cellulolyticum]ACL77045.1 hypothetical protein Ccel_2736 [Ruminiclostridium cellulolyticum H10]